VDGLAEGADEPRPNELGRALAPHA
jgi:hypothetical protein